MSKETHTYTNDEITVLWQPKLCIHSGICARGLSQVFKPRERPWIQLEQATTEEIKAQVDKCPSGAISWFPNEDQ
ncbi:MAG: (4Fe-4S)-binding protein [Fimbriimonadaceae bacterium]|nr:MAG: (4Fe-4S)-binding protein [Fimbriimonadaceae bacterium]